MWNHTTLNCRYLPQQMLCSLLRWHLLHYEASPGGATHFLHVARQMILKKPDIKKTFVNQNTGLRYYHSSMSDGHPRKIPGNCSYPLSSTSLRILLVSLYTRLQRPSLAMNTPFCGSLQQLKPLDYRFGITSPTPLSLTLQPSNHTQRRLQSEIRTILGLGEWLTNSNQPPPTNVSLKWAAD